MIKLKGRKNHIKMQNFLSLPTSLFQSRHKILLLLLDPGKKTGKKFKTASFFYYERGFINYYCNYEILYYMIVIIYKLLYERKEKKNK